MAGLARRLAPAAALGGLALVIVGVADPALAGRTEATATATGAGSAPEAPSASEAAGAGAPAAEPITPTCDIAESVTGGAVMTQWGPVQVSASVAGGQLCEVHAVSWPSGDGKSQMINSYAIPQLDAAASQSGTAFDYVSGATYTSEAYRQSLQSLLDAL